MKKFLGTIGKVSIGVAIGGMVTGGGWLIYEFVFNQNKNNISKINFDWVYKDFNLNLDLKVAEGSEKTSMPYLGEEGLKKLVDRMKNDLGYGPEICGLNSINIVEGGYISGSDYGVYIDSTKEIFINSKTLRHIVPQEGTIDDKVEVVFQILFHEYGHYIASSYLKNIKPGTTPSNEFWMHANNISSGDFLWNKYFIDNFRRILHYNDETPFTHGVWSDGTVNLGSIYGLKQIFDITNGKNYPMYSKLTDKTIIGGKYQRTHKRSFVKESNLRYLYSIDELYTRKYQQIGMGMINTLDSKKGGIKDGWYKLPSSETDDFIATPMLTDTTRYQFDSIIPKDYPGNWDDFGYMNDAPYKYSVSWRIDNTRAKDMYNLMLEEFGQSLGTDITFITSKNKAIMVDESGYVVNAKHPVIPNEIKFGGFVPDDSYQVVGYYQDPVAKTGFTTISVIDCSLFQYGYKNKLNDRNTNKASGEQYFYITREWKNVNDFKNKKLYFATDNKGSNPVPLSSVRSGKIGLASNYFKEAPEVFKSTNESYYYAELSDDNVAKIRGGSWQD